jgi:recombination protein RecT
MSNEVQKFINNSSVQTRINQLLDKRASQFTTSLLTAVNSNERLAACRPDTVLNAALTAASMDLPINQNLGFAALVPYGDECQFQMQYKGYIQLAQRSGKYRTIAAAPVYEGQLLTNDPLRGITFDWSVKRAGDAEPIGYAAFFELLNGFEKTSYMSREDVDAHGRKFSKAYQYDLKSGKKNSPWSTNFDAMATKTVIKALISTFGPQSTDMQQAIEYDQAVVTDKGVKYVDNDESIAEQVKASDEQKDAIIAANQVNDDPGDISDDNGAQSIFADIDQVAPAPITENLTEKANKRYGKRQ